MKKIILCTAVVAGMLSMVSCESKSGTSTMNFQVVTYNHIADMVGGGEPVVAASSYKFNFDMMAGSVTIGTELPVSTGNNISFVTPAISYTGGMYQYQDNYYEIINVEAMTAGTASDQSNVTNLDCQLTSIAYYPPQIQGLPQVAVPNGYKYAVMGYSVGSKYKVQTFWSDMTFKGGTTTHYTDANGTLKEYSSDEVLYRVIMNAKDKKATVILYNAKLAAEMPKPITNIVLKDLPVSFNVNGYTIKATDVVPEVYEAGVATPNPHFPFDSFTLTSLGDMTNCNIYYKVAGKYQGEFNGSYVLKIKSEK